MNITRATDYSIRLLTTLAAQGGESSCRELADQIHVPFNHLAKLVQTLSKEGFLITKRGKGGGIKLAKCPSKIDLAEVYEAIEGPICLNDCLFHSSVCRFSGSCKVRGYLGKVQSTVKEMLSNRTILDLAPSLN